MPEPALKHLSLNATTLIVVAASAEARAAGAPDILAWRRTRLNDRLHLVLAGVGKSNAAGATAACAHAPVASVLSAGLAGALPGSGLRIGDVVLATRSAFADEGILIPGAFRTCQDMGFPLAPAGGDVPPSDPDLLAKLAPLAERQGTIATVSTCSGTDQAAATVASRTGAIAEAMEGAAVLLAAARLGLPAAEIRVISNTTGDRDRQTWDLPRALSRLAGVIGSL